MNPRTWLATAAVTVLTASLFTTATPASAIVGGSDATGDYRAMVDVQREHADGSFSLTCGGVVTDYRGRIGVLTGAHCVTDDVTGGALPAEQIRLAVGSAIRDAGRIVEVTSIGVPDGWDWAAPGPDGQPDQVNDWAILFPSNARGLHPIDITRLAEASRLRLLGWGSTKVSGEGPLPVKLQKLDDSRIVDPQNCPDVFMSTGEICVQSTEGTGPCYGDSGSPALVRTHRRWSLRGTASRIVDLTCGTSNSVYTDAAYFWREIARMLLAGKHSYRPHTLAVSTGHRELWPAFPNPVK